MAVCQAIRYKRVVLELGVMHAGGRAGFQEAREAEGQGGTCGAVAAPSDRGALLPEWQGPARLPDRQPALDDQQPAQEEELHPWG